jgi:transposase-like protein
LSREATLQSGSGFRNTTPKGCPQRNRISEFIVDETAIKAGSEYLWLWVAIEPKNKQILALSISKERNMVVAIERFIIFG